MPEIAPAGPSRRRSLLADAALLSVAAVWGFNFVVIKHAIGSVAPLTFLMLEHVTATIMLVAIMPRSVVFAARREWLYGAVLGVCLFAVGVSQVLGLKYTSPAKTAFITGLYVAIVPFLVWAIARRSPGLTQVAGAAVAVAGLGVLSLRGNFTLSLGDTLNVVAALSLACQITATGMFAPKVKPATLAVTQIAVAATLYVVVTPLTGHISLALPWQVWAAVAWTAAMGTVYGFGVQASAQRYTTASHAAVILCLEGVFAAAFGVLFGLDSITWRLIGGAGLILTGILIVELVPGRGPRVNAAGAGPACGVAPAAAKQEIG